MRIGISGYGKMGKAIEAVAIDRGHEISFRISSSNLGDWEKMNSDNTDLVIEFSNPDSAIHNMERCIEKRLPVVVGTTGWYDEMDMIQNKVDASDASFLWASNFSIGVNLFFELNKNLAKMMQTFSDYKADVTEIHHIHKLDKPSGTAITIAEGLINNHKDYQEWKLDGKEKAPDLNVHSIREEEVPGTHMVKYESEIDLIEIKHEAKSRKGFAIGSVIAAEWLLGKKGFFNISDVLQVNNR